MDASKLIERRRMAAEIYLHRTKPQDAGMVTYKNEKIAAAGYFKGSQDITKQMNPTCCSAATKDTLNAADSYSDTRLDIASFAGNNQISHGSRLAYMAGQAICCAAVPSSAPPGITVNACNCLGPIASATYTPACKPGYNQTPRFVSQPCSAPGCSKPNIVTSLPSGYIPSK